MDERKKPAESAKLAGDWQDDLNEAKGEGTTGTQRQDETAERSPISEDEARDLLREEKRLAEREYDRIEKKNRKVLIVVVVVALVLCVLGGVFAVMMANRGDNKQESQDTGTTTPVEDEKPTEKPEEAPKDNDELVKAMVAKVRTATESYLNDEEDWFVFEEDNNIRPLYQSSTMKAATSLNRSFGFKGDSVKQSGEAEFSEIWAKIGSEGFREAVAKVFADNGFVETGRDWSPIPEMINYETGVVCTGIDTGLPIYFGCGHISWLNEEQVALVNALAEAYSAKEGHPVGSLNAQVGDIRDSKVKPYQTINANLFGAAGLFYRTSPESEWKFFMGTQAVLSCDEYNTEELRKAYAGEACFNTETNEDSVVKLEEE